MEFINLEDRSNYCKWRSKFLWLTFRTTFLLLIKIILVHWSQKWRYSNGYLCCAFKRVIMNGWRLPRIWENERQRRGRGVEIEGKLVTWCEEVCTTLMSRGRLLPLSAVPSIRSETSEPWKVCISLAEPALKGRTEKVQRSRDKGKG